MGRPRRRRSGRDRPTAYGLLIEGEEILGMPPRIKQAASRLVGRLANPLHQCSILRQAQSFRPGFGLERRQEKAVLPVLNDLCTPSYIGGKYRTSPGHGFCYCIAESLRYRGLHKGGSLREQVSELIQG
jgi:hypothetical protein